MSESVKDLVKEIKTGLSQTSSSRKDEIRVMKAMLNDPSYEVDEYGKDGVMVGHAKGKVAFFFASMKHKLRFLTHYPLEVMWAPYQMLVYYLETIIKKQK